MQPEINMDLSRLPECMNSKFYPMLFRDERYKVIMGGAGSGKSYSVAQALLVRAVMNPGEKFLCLRKVGVTVRDSILALFQTIITQWGWWPIVKLHKSTLTLRFVNGSMIRCGGLDDEEKLKSIHGISSVWLEETTEFTERDFVQVDLRLRGRTPSKKEIYLTFNPVSVMHWLKERFFDSPGSKDVYIHHSTVEDNKWGDDVYKKVIKELATTNPSMYKVYGLGQWGELKGLVYDIPPVIVEDDWPNLDEFDYVIYGLDFGFNNPTALTFFGVKDNVIYEREMLYEREMTNTDLRTILPELIYCSPYVDPMTIPIYADNAEPDRIEEIAADGWNIFPCHKGQVKDGIDFVKKMKIRLHEESRNLLKEYYSYCWQVDKNDNPLDEPVKVFDHGHDAKRYALVTHLREQEVGTMYVGGGFSGVSF